MKNAPNEAASATIQAPNNHVHARLDEFEFSPQLELKATVLFFVSTCLLT